MNSINKITIELSLPRASDEGCEEELLEQTAFLISFWKDVLVGYKAKGVIVPTLYIKKIKSTIQQNVIEANATKQFYKALIDHHLVYMPKDNVGAQMKAIKALFATGKTAEELIALYEDSRSTYKLTSWFTVKYKLSKPAQEEIEDTTFYRKELDEEEKTNIVNRLKGTN